MSSAPALTVMVWREGDELVGRIDLPKNWSAAPVECAFYLQVAVECAFYLQVANEKKAVPGVLFLCGIFRGTISSYSMTY